MKLLAALLACVALFACDDAPGKRELRELVRQQLRDPDSARFSSEQLFRYQTQHVLCGEVNARNAMGGYAGATRFFAWKYRDRSSGEVVFAPAASAGPSAELAFLDRYLLLCQNVPAQEGET